MVERDAVFPANPHALYEAHRYSPAVRSNGFLFVSGQVGARQDGSPEPDLAAQVQLAFDNLSSILNAAGASFGDVVDVTLFMVDAEKNFETIWPVLQANWGDKPYPNVTAVGVTWLAGFTFEVKAIARLAEEQAA
jgi:enamine deaminase RidA (YjgF/YER057c/UK114 family)